MIARNCVVVVWVRALARSGAKDVMNAPKFEGLEGKESWRGEASTRSKIICSVIC